MNPLKAAAVIAGSVVLAGATTPAFAQTDLTEFMHSLDGAASTLTEHSAVSVPVQPRTEALNAGKKRSAPRTTKSMANQLNEPDALLGGLPLKG
ncbi:hypothetical protein SUDANB58_01938 [Streptomyces sp. enrichment culture]|uniref:hypothetical protein n=1 Tax=Streptomyces sp. enrichment culture TaxID=1795815 RepID=UPI003F56BA2E